MKLIIPLGSSQIAAAKCIYNLTSSFRVDQSLHMLGQRFPEQNFDAVLLKAAALNSLYFANNSSLPAFANHAVSALARGDLSGANLVECLASPPGEGHCWSLASKFAHFYIDPEQYPIFDKYADRMVQYHLKGQPRERDGDNRYHAFHDDFWQLKQSAGLQEVSNRDLDLYLWLAGQRLAWSKRREWEAANPGWKQQREPPKGPERVGKEMAALFDRLKAAQPDQLRMLLPLYQQ